MSAPITLTIAGSDSSGGAGIQADLKTFTVLGCYGMSVITALTAQNTTAVDGIFPVTADFVTQQLGSVTNDIAFTYAKSGMLFDHHIICAVADYFKQYSDKKLILDPVMISESGSRLLKPESIEALTADLIPQAWLITPNIPEAEAITGITIKNENDYRKAADKLLEAGAKHVLIKGGHFHHTDGITDLYCSSEKHRFFHGSRLNNPNTHGTGCTISAAITAFSAKGYAMEQAIEYGRNFVREGIAQGEKIGKGAGPTNHIAAGEHYRNTKGYTV